MTENITEDTMFSKAYSEKHVLPLLVLVSNGFVPHRVERHSLKRLHPPLTMDPSDAEFYRSLHFCKHMFIYPYQDGMLFIVINSLREDWK